MDTTRWVFLAYRLPREPSTPRITLWRKLRRMGALQLLDGLVGLPLDPRTREQLDWLADEVVEAGGEASVWLAEPTTVAQERDLITRLAHAAAAEYQAVLIEARAAMADDAATRHRTLLRLRRELRRIAERDYVATPEYQAARDAVEALAMGREVTP